MLLQDLSDLCLDADINLLTTSMNITMRWQFNLAHMMLIYTYQHLRCYLVLSWKTERDFTSESTTRFLLGKCIIRLKNSATKPPELFLYLLSSFKDLQVVRNCWRMLAQSW